VNRARTSSEERAPQLAGGSWRNRTRTILSRAGRSPALLGLVGLVVFGGVIELLPHTGLVKAEYFPPSSRIGQALWHEVGQAVFWNALGDTLVTWITGLAIAVAGGIVIGMVIGSLPWLRELTASTIEFLRPIPSVALIPGLIVLLAKPQATLFIVVYAAFWQMLIQVLYGAGDVDPVARDTARSYHLGPLRRVRYIVWPTALPYVMTGVRLAASVALILTITGELIIGSPGLGYEIDQAYTGLDAPTMFALIVATGLIGVVANTVTRAAERRVLRWHPSIRGEIPV
jgi:ABC-type nitrate/sulfonate/bicarbonate transport system permease component